MPTQPYYVEIDGKKKRVPGTTTVISNVSLGSKEGLLVWANRLGQQGIDHRDARNKAADDGTCAHDMVEAFVKGNTFDADKYPPDVVDRATPAFEAFRAWLKNSRLVPYKSEIPLVSERYRYGGTIDLVFTDEDGRIVLGDLKTGKLRDNHLLQLAAYSNLWEENFPDEPVTGGYYILSVIRGSDDDNPDMPVMFHNHHWSNLDLPWKMFLKCRELYEDHKILRKMV